MSDHADIVRDVLEPLQWESLGEVGAALAALDALVAERDAYIRAFEKQSDEYEQWPPLLEAAEAEVARLREALRKWESVSPHHRGECLFLTVGADGCTCGLQDARDMTRAALAPSATGGDNAALGEEA
jgi:hypothetical protein